MGTRLWMDSRGWQTPALYPIRFRTGERAVWQCIFIIMGGPNLFQDR